MCVCVCVCVRERERERERERAQLCTWACVNHLMDLFFADMTDGKGKGADSSGAAEEDTHEGSESHTSVA